MSKKPNKKKRGTPPPVTLAYTVKPQEGLEEAGTNVLRLIEKANKKHPGAPIHLEVGIEGYKEENPQDPTGTEYDLGMRMFHGPFMALLTHGPYITSVEVSGQVFTKAGRAKQINVPASPMLEWDTVSEAMAITGSKGPNGAPRLLPSPRSFPPAPSLF